MTFQNHGFTSEEKAVAAAAIADDPAIGISALAKRIGRGKDAAKALRTELLREREASVDLIRRRPGELDFALERLFQHPFNTRIINPDDADILALAKSIERRGQTEPLTAIRIADSLAEAAVIDGARRLSALRKLGWQTAKVVLVELAPHEIVSAIQTRDRDQRRWSAYERALHIEAILPAYASEAECAKEMGLAPDTFSKARAPAQLPVCVIEKISDLRRITGKAAAAVRAEWNRDPNQILATMSAIARGSDARQVFAAILSEQLPRTVALPRADLEDVLARLARDRAVVPELLADLLHQILGGADVYSQDALEIRK